MPLRNTLKQPPGFHSGGCFCTLSNRAAIFVIFRQGTNTMTQKKAPKRSASGFSLFFFYFFGSALEIRFVFERDPIGFLDDDTRRVFKGFHFHFGVFAAEFPV